MRPLPRRARQTSKVGHIHNQMVGHVQSLHPNKSNGKLQIHTSLGTFEREIPQRRRGSATGNADLALFVVQVYNQAGGIIQGQKVSYSLTGQNPELPSSWTESIASELTDIKLPPAIAAGPSSNAHTPEALQPSYGIDSRIIAARFGGVWYDCNRDARHWDVDYRLVNVCIKVNGVDTTWQMYVRGGPAFAP